MVGGRRKNFAANAWGLQKRREGGLVLTRYFTLYSLLFLFARCHVGSGSTIPTPTQPNPVPNPGGFLFGLYSTTRCLTTCEWIPFGHELIAAERGEREKGEVKV